jgi:phosphatidylglycerol---prolipoprotein diacylglyceryl transferase
MNNFINKNRYIIYLFAIPIVFVFYQLLRGNWQIVSYFEVFSIKIYYYSFFIFFGIIIVVYLFEKNFPLKYKKLVNIDTALLFVLIPAIIGARIWHISTEWNLYANNISGVFMIWEGGLGLYGGLIGGKIGALIYTKIHKVKLLPILDILVVFLPLGQAIGRFGNFFNQEIYGPITTLPWGQYVSFTNNFHHPLFLYEAIGNLIIFCLLYFNFKKHGSNNNYVNLGLYIFCYGILRFILEFLRDTPDFNQLFSLIISIIAGIYLLSLKFNKRL